MIFPDGADRYPSVIYLHRGMTDKYQFKDEAVLLAKRGVISLLLNSPFNSGCSDARNPRLGYIITVLIARRAVDLLMTPPQVDSERIGYVGHSFGATWGGVLAGVEPRLHTLVQRFA